MDLKTELKLQRKWYSKNTTIGELFINGTYFSLILEDVCRDLNHDGDLNDPGEIKVDGKTCIPAGRYQVIIDQSTRFKKMMLHILNVPGFEGIRIHPGNYDVDTKGCLLPGNTRGVDFVGNSRDTYEKLYTRLSLLLKTHQVFITIEDLPLIP